MHKKPSYRTQLMHMVAFLPVPPQQLFPSGGSFLTFTLQRALERSGGPLFLPFCR